MKYTILLLISILIMACQPSNKWGKLNVVSGYEYDKHTSGSGVKANEGDFVKFSFSVLGDDTFSIQAVGDPSTFPVVELPKSGDDLKPNPVLEILLGCQVGDSFSVYMPIDSMQKKSAAYDKFEYLKYNMAVKNVFAPDAYKEYRDAEATKEEKLRHAYIDKGDTVAIIVKETLTKYNSGILDVVTTESGLKYFIHKQGDGSIANQGDNAVVNYYGVLINNGNMFDNSYSRGKPFTFKVATGGVIKGWDEALQIFPSGSEVSVFIPAGLAYAGTPRKGIPANSALMFHMDIQ